MFGTCHGYSRVVRILLNRGADVSRVNELGETALHVSVFRGHLAVTKLLIKAGADLEARDSRGCTPLYTAAENGHSWVITALIQAGANPDTALLPHGETPLYISALSGHVGAVRALLRANADPLLGTPLLGTPLQSGQPGKTAVPLDMATVSGHSEVVLELIQQVGIEGCGGASGGVDSLFAATGAKHVGIMTMLLDAGVVDTGAVLRAAAAVGLEASVKFLLQQEEGRRIGENSHVNSRDDVGAMPIGGDAYVNSPGRIGFTPLHLSCVYPRIVRRLIDAGADTSLRLASILSNGSTALDYTIRCLRNKKIGGKQATEEQLNGMEGTRRLLLQVEAVYAASWLWYSDIPFVGQAAEVFIPETGVVSTPLRTMLPLLRRRARRRAVLLGALFR